MSVQETRLPVPIEIKERLGALMSEVMAEVEIADEFQVNDEESARLAGEQLSSVSKMIRRLNDERLRYTRPYDALKSDIKVEYDAPVEKLERASRALRSRLQGYLDEQERRRQEALRVERERIERERREAEARLEAERKRAAELKTPAARERAEARIEDAAAAVVEAAVSAPVVQQATKVKGFGMRKELVVDYDKSDLTKLAGAVFSNPKLARFLSFNTVEINKVVKAMQAGAEDIIPGIAMIERTITTSR